MFHIKYIVLCWIGIIDFYPIHAQPLNDNCSGALLLTASSQYRCGYSFTAGTTEDATDSGMNDACGGVGDDDVWFKFEATQNRHWVYIYGYSTGIPVMVFYAGSCNSLDSLTCFNPNDTYGSALLEGLTIGDTIYFRVFEADNTPAIIEFDLCVFSPLVHDICSGAVEIIPDANNEVCEWTVTTEGATDQNIGVGSCGIDIAYDVWYKFTAISNRHIISLSTIFDYSLPGSFVVEIRDGCSGAEIACMTVSYDGGYSELDINSLVSGDEYYIRLYGSGSSEPSSGTLCIQSPPLEVEDDCITAEMLTINENVCNEASYDNSLGGATETTVPLDTCTTGPYLDLWYAFEVTNSTAAVKLTVYSAGDIAVAAFTGTSCNSLSHLQCVNDYGIGENELLYLTGLTIGDTVYVRVYDGNLNNTPINFDICVFTPPVNDFCGNALEISITDGANCSGALSGNTNGATGSGGCSGGTADDDIWYWFEAMDTLHQIQLNDLNISSPVIEIFNSDCLGSQFGCIQGVQYISTGFTAGQIYYIRIYSHDNQYGQGSFAICVSTPPINIFCSEAFPLPVNSGINCTTIYTGNSGGQGYSIAKYSFEATSPTHIMYINPISPMTGISNSNQIFDSNCDLISFIGYNYFNNTHRSYYQNFTVGEEYKFEVNAGYPVEGDYNICITESVSNDECTNATLIPNSSINTNCGCSVLVSGSCYGSTPSFTNGHDVWYSFIATSTSMAFSLSPTNGSSSVSGSIYASNCTTSLGTINTAGLTLNSLTIGSEYKIRVIAKQSNESPGDFNLCLKELTNDFCASPDIITPQAGTTCASPISGTTVEATPSNPTFCVHPDIPDVWYQFTATATTHLVKVTPLSSGFYPNVYVYRKSSSGASCDLNCIQSTIICSLVSDTVGFMPHTALLSSLTVGFTYLIAVANRSDDSPSGDFNICVLSPGTSMNVWTTVSETYAPLTDAHVGLYEFPMKKITLNMTGTTSAKTVTQIVVNTTGMINTSDVLTAKLYYAGASSSSNVQGSLSEFQSSNTPGQISPILFGAVVANPNGQLVFNGIQNIVGQTGEYKRYFYLIYDVACQAVIGNELNAEVVSITISSTNFTPFEGVNTSNTIAAQNRYYTKATGLWSEPATWYCGVPPNGPDILPITLYHDVSVDDVRQTNDIEVKYLKSLHVLSDGVLTLGQSSQGSQTGYSNTTLSARWGIISVLGTLNVNGNLWVGEYYGSENSHFGQLNVAGVINIDGNDGTAEGSGSSNIIIGTTLLFGSGFINILDPTYDNPGEEFNYNVRLNTNKTVDWTISFGGGDDNSLVEGFYVKMIGQATGSGFSTLRVKNVIIRGGLLGEKREVVVASTVLPCQNLTIEEDSELIGTVGLSGHFVNNGFYTSGLYNNNTGEIVCADNFGFNTYSANGQNQSISGTGFFRANATLPYPTSHSANAIYSLLVHSNAIVFLETPLNVNKLMIKSGTIATSDSSLLSLGSLENPGMLCQTNGAFQYFGLEFTGTFETWSGGGIHGPFRRFFQNNTSPDYRGFMPFRNGSSIRNMGFKLKNNTLNGSITANFITDDYGSRCLPLVNEQGIHITNVSPSGYWKFNTDNLEGNYDVMINSHSFLKRNGGMMTDLTNIRSVISPNIPTFIHSNSTTSNGPTTLFKVLTENVNFHQDTFVLCLGGGNNAAGPDVSPNTFIVNSNQDSGPGTFREGIVTTFCNDTIRFDQSLNGDTILLSQILPPINKNVTVIMEPGQNIVIKNQSNQVILDIPAFYEMEMRETNITGNHTSSPLIYNLGVLILDNCRISNSGVLNSQPILLNEGNGEIKIKNECEIID
ncbi:MAG: hypothetical protein WAT79_07840 [Saprospiraceae bacterium]